MQPTIHRSERICIDISDNVVSIIKLDPDGIMMRAGSAKAPTMPKVPDDAYVTDLSSAIRKAAWAAKVSMGFGASCVVVSGMPDIVIQRFTWPDMPEDALLSIVQEEMIPYLPGSPSHYTISCEVLNREGGTIEVIAAAMPIEHTAAINTACRWANFKPKRMDLRENARGRFAHYWCTPVEGEVPTTYAILDAGPGLANIAFYHNGLFHSNRYFIPQMVKLGEVQDFEMLMTVKAGGVDDNENAMSYDPDKLSEEVISAINHFHHSLQGGKLACVLFMDEENIPGIEENLRANLNVLTLKPSQWVSPGLKRPNLRRIDQTQFLDAFAAGMPPLSDHGSRMDLRIPATPIAAADRAMVQTIASHVKTTPPPEPNITPQGSNPFDFDASNIDIKPVHQPVEEPLPARPLEPVSFGFDDHRTKSEAKPYEDPYVKPEPRQYEDPYVKPEPRPYEDPYVKPEPKPYEDPYVKPEPRPYEDSYVKTEPRPYEDPYVKPEPRPYEDPYVKPEPRPYEDPYVKPELHHRTDPFPARPEEPASVNIDDPFVDIIPTHKATLPEPQEPVKHHEFPFDPIKAKADDKGGFPYAMPEDPRQPFSFKPLIAAFAVVAVVFLIAVLIPLQETLNLRSELQYLENSIAGHVSVDAIIMLERERGELTSQISARQREITRINESRNVVHRFYTNPPAQRILPEVLYHAGIWVDSIYATEHQVRVRGRTNAFRALLDGTIYLREHSPYRYHYGLSFDVDETYDNSGVDEYGFTTYTIDLILHHNDTPFWLAGHERGWQ